MLKSMFFLSNIIIVLSNYTLCPRNPLDIKKLAVVPRTSAYQNIK